MTHVQCHSVADQHQFHRCICQARTYASVIRKHLYSDTLQRDSHCMTKHNRAMTDGRNGVQHAGRCTSNSIHHFSVLLCRFQQSARSICWVDQISLLASRQL
jgi:hypothetical protein